MFMVPKNKKQRSLGAPCTCCIYQILLQNRCRKSVQHCGSGRPQAKQQSSGVLSFCITLFIIAFFGGASAAVYNTASVLYGKDAVVSVDKNENSVQFTWMNDTVFLPAEIAERIVRFAASCSSWLPGNLRSDLLAAGSFHQLVFAFWNWVDTLPQ